VHGDADIATVAAAIANPARARMLNALIGGAAVPAGELARAARIAPSTASSHLGVLVAAGLVRVESSGRRRVHRLSGERAAHALETLAAIAPQPPVRSLRESGRVAAERAGRSCYDHLAGALGVAVTDRLCVLGALDEASLALRDPAPFRALGVDIAAVVTGRRPLTRSCVDWSERRPHLAGALGAALLDAMLRGGWLVRRPQSRALTVTAEGHRRLVEQLGLELRA
jgi:DNA-binding transcriptional ArsR family regulator